MQCLFQFDEGDESLLVGMLKVEAA